MIYYHGSPLHDLTELRAGSWITPRREIAEVMGRHHLDTGRTWTDDDLLTPYGFQGEPNWKPGREPHGKPHVYEVRPRPHQIDQLDNDVEHRTTVMLPIRRLENLDSVMNMTADAVATEKPMHPDDAREQGYVIDSCCYPWLAYKGGRFQPTESHECYTERESDLIRRQQFPIMGTGCPETLTNRDIVRMLRRRFSSLELAALVRAAGIVPSGNLFVTSKQLANVITR